MEFLRKLCDFGVFRCIRLILRRSVKNQRADSFDRLQRFLNFRGENSFSFCVRIQLRIKGNQNGRLTVRKITADFVGSHRACQSGLNALFF